MVRMESVESYDFQFPKNELENAANKNKLDGYIIEPLHIDDFDKGYTNVLSQLSDVKNISKEDFKKRFEFLKTCNHTKYFIVIRVAQKKDVIATGSLLLDHKFIHSCGFAGHIEDIVVDEQFRGKRLGKCIVMTLLDLAADLGAYKTILSCSEQNKNFYERCGLKPKELTMAKYFEHSL